MKTLLALLFTLSSITAYAQTESVQYSQFLEESSPAEAGMSAERLIGILFKQTQVPTGDETAWKFRQLVGQAIDD